MTAVSDGGTVAIIIQSVNEMNVPFYSVLCATPSRALASMQPMIPLTQNYACPHDCRDNFYNVGLHAQ